MALAAVKSLSMNPFTNRRQVVQALAGSSMLLTAPLKGLAETEHESDDERQELLQRLKERRQLMQASRSTNDRQDYLDLSRQRAKLYNTTSKAWSCPPNIPCL